MSLENVTTEDYDDAFYLSNQVEQAKRRAVLAASDAGVARDRAASAEQAANEAAKRAQRAAQETSSAPQDAAEAKAAATVAVEAKGAAVTAKEAAEDAAAISSTAANTAKADAIAAASKDATTKANAAKVEAISAASADATDKAGAAKQDAINNAAADASTKAAQAKADAIADAVEKYGTLPGRVTKSEKLLEPVRAGDKDGWRVADQTGQVALEVSPQGAVIMGGTEHRATEGGWRLMDQSGQIAFEVTPDGHVMLGNTMHRTDAEGWRVMDQEGRVAVEVTPDGRFHAYDSDGAGVAVTEWHVFLCAGQSNMKGHAQPYGGGLYPEDPRILEYGATTREISPAQVPLDNIGGKTGLSPATIFAREYLKTQPSRVGVLLVPAAWGGTGFNDGSGAGATWDNRQAGAGVVDLYGESLTQTAEALAAQPGAELKAILWHQGESNQNTAPAEYEAQLDRLITNYRTAFGNSSLPFVLGQMSPETIASTPGKAAIDAVHQDTLRRLQYTGFAPAELGGTNYNDTTHFSRAGVEQLGREYVRAYERALTNNSGFGPQQPRNVTATFIQGALTVRWEQAPRRVTGYKVEYRIDGGAWVEAVRTHPMNLSETITGLTGAAAEVRITSVNLSQQMVQQYPVITPHITW